MVCSEDARELALGDDAVSVFVEDHESELELVVLAGAREVGQGDHELADVDLARLLVVEELEEALALWTWIDLENLAELRVVDHAALVLVRGLEALVRLLDGLGLEVAVPGELVERGLFRVARGDDRLARRRRSRRGRAGRAHAAAAAQAGRGLPAARDHLEELGEAHLAVAVSVDHANHLVDLFVRDLLADVDEDVSNLGGADEVVLVEIEVENLTLKIFLSSN